MQRRLTRSESQNTDFDVITGPSMASACPVVETAPADAAPAPVLAEPVEPAEAAA